MIFEGLREIFYNKIQVWFTSQNLISFSTSSIYLRYKLIILETLIQKFDLKYWYSSCCEHPDLQQLFIHTIKAF